MLRRAVPLIVTGLLAVANSAQALSPGEHVVCPPSGTVCYVIVDTAGLPGSEPVSGHEHAAPTCHASGSTASVDCYDVAFGWWSNVDSCYYMRVSPAPPATDPIWQGHYPDGAIYQATCPGLAGTGGGWFWRPSAPPGYGGGPGTAAQLADRAIAQLALNGPDIGVAPAPGKVGLVGLPVWMWTRVRATTWGPISATASLPGISVTATATAQNIVWQMGDGQVVTCDSPGTPYSPSAGQTTSPTCGYTYLTSSAHTPGHAFTVHATTTWDVTWSGGGTSGATTQTRTSTTQVQIGELQVLVS